MSIDYKEYLSYDKRSKLNCSLFIQQKLIRLMHYNFIKLNEEMIDPEVLSQITGINVTIIEGAYEMLQMNKYIMKENASYKCVFHFDKLPQFKKVYDLKQYIVGQNLEYSTILTSLKRVSVKSFISDFYYKAPEDEYYKIERVHYGDKIPMFVTVTYFGVDNLIKINKSILSNQLLHEYLLKKDPSSLVKMHRITKSILIPEYYANMLNENEGTPSLAHEVYFYDKNNKILIYSQVYQNSRISIGVTYNNQNLIKKII